jgi:hypothetical protein
LDGEEENKNNINLYAVFDGHGGKAVSKYLKDNLPLFFTKKFDKNIFAKPEKFSNYVNKVYDSIQENLKKNHPRAANYCGSTACVSIINKEDKKKYLWMINVGDSRGVLCNKDGEAVPLTTDHKPNLSVEKERIEKLGGKITFDGVDWRVKSLSLSRAFGDLDCCPYVTHLPNIYRYKLSIKDKFIIIACDGLWDVLSNDEAVNYVKELQNKNFNGNYAKELSNYAYAKGSMDNITTIIYMFPNQIN